MLLWRVLLGELLGKKKAAQHFSQDPEWELEFWIAGRVVYYQHTYM